MENQKIQMKAFINHLLQIINREYLLIIALAHAKLSIKPQLSPKYTTIKKKMATLKHQK